MSIVTDINGLDESIIDCINNELKIKIVDKYGFGNNTRYISPYDLNDPYLTLPFNFAVNNLKLPRKPRTKDCSIELKFEGELREEQELVKKEALKILNKKGSVILSMYCGFGKTITSIFLTSVIKMKTLIIVNKLVLMTQWEESIKRFCPNSSVQKLKPKCKKKDCDFYIINAINAEKMGKECFQDIGCVIVDEAHLIMAETVSKCLNVVSPRYLIGLTATPYRPDGLNKLLDFYFGEDKIIRELYREHLVFKVDTGFEPTIELSSNGRVNWGMVLESQAKDETRNNIILKILTTFSDRNFLVLVKRVEQGEYLMRKLLEDGEDVTSLLGSNQKFEVDARILIGTCSKVGTGFDHPKLNTLLLAADVEEYFIQYLGRCMRTRDEKPIIFDLVDSNNLLKKHYNTRRKIYEKHGGKIQKFVFT